MTVSYKKNSQFETLQIKHSTKRQENSCSHNSGYFSRFSGGYGTETPVFHAAERVLLNGVELGSKVYALNSIQQQQHTAAYNLSGCSYLGQK